MLLTKTPSTPSDQSIGVLNGIRKISELAQISPDEIKLILHGTTVATNAVLEGKGGFKRRMGFFGMDSPCSCRL
ncbi:hypothetical protein BH18ACI4_BH18ACI4_01770 [soil metagenome]